VERAARVNERDRRRFARGGADRRRRRRQHRPFVYSARDEPNQSHVISSLVDFAPKNPDKDSLRSNG